MRSVRTAIVILLTAAYTFGQEPAPAMRIADFSSMFWDAWWKMSNLSWKGFRYTETRGDWVLTVEADRNGSSRASYVNSATGALDRECAVLGDKVFERSGAKPWTLSTRAEYVAEETARVRRGAKRQTAAAIAPRHVLGLGAQGNLHLWVRPPMTGVITTPGSTNLNGRAVIMYKFTGAFVPDRGDVSMVRYDNDYWFDKETGAIAKARSRKEEVRSTRTATEVVEYEFQIDHSITISPPPH
jgi:hypothetical protein